jgi:hypothetical protein
MKIIMCLQNNLTHDGRGSQIGEPPPSPDLHPFKFSFPWNYAKIRVHSHEDENNNYVRNRILVAVYSMTQEMPQRAREEMGYLTKI